MNHTAMNKQEFIDLCAVYALGALDGADLARFRAALVHADAEMNAALAEALQAAGNLSLAAPDASPSPAAKDRLMSRVRASREEVRTESVPAPAARPVRRPAASAPGSWLDRLFGSGISPAPRLAGAFGLLVLAAGLLVYALSLNGDLKRERVVLEYARNRIVVLEDSLSQREALLEVIRSREMQVVVMAGLEAAPGGYGKVIWDPERKTAVLQVVLPPQPEDKDYQLWVIRDQKPVDAGVFQVSATSGERGGLYKIDRLVETDRQHINAFAVTLEPKGGVPQPTGKMFLLGGVEI